MLCLETAGKGGTRLSFPRAQIPEVIHMVAVGTIIADCPPHRTVRAALPHSAPTLEDWREVLLLAHRSSPGTLIPRAVAGIGVGLNDVLLGPRPFLPRLRRRSLFFVRLAHR